MDREDCEAQFQTDRRAALAGTYDDFLRHKADYPGVYNFTGRWASDPAPPSPGGR